MTTSHGPGQIVTAHFSDGVSVFTNGCDCECHEDCADEQPLPAGVYITVRLDNDDARVGLGRVDVRAPEGTGR